MHFILNLIQDVEINIASDWKNHVVLPNGNSVTFNLLLIWKIKERKTKNVGFFLTICQYGLVISVYLSSLPVALGRRLVVTGDSARIQDETTEGSA